MKNYRLASDGDNLEMDCWPLFLQSQFPAYESFWQRYVVPISNRPRNIWLKADEELQQIGKGHHDVCTAQLHYTVLWHLHRAFEILASGDAMTEAQTVEGIVRLSSALDVADELLGRFTNPARYDPWEDRGKAGGQGARSNWRNKLKLPETHPVRQLREYRNHLVHGRIMPSMGRDRHPAMGLQRHYFDWRKVTDPAMQASLDATHFQRRREILASAWKTTLSYLRDMWAQHLLASAGA